MTDPLPLNLPNYDPPEKDRVYYESILKGEVGYLVRVNNVLFVDLGHGRRVAYRNTEWKPVRELRPLTEWHIGKIAFEADKAMLFALGKLRESKREWLGLKQEEKMRWVLEGPEEGADKIRVELYQAIRAALSRAAA